MCENRAHVLAHTLWQQGQNPLLNALAHIVFQFGLWRHYHGRRSKRLRAAAGCSVRCYSRASCACNAIFVHVDGLLPLILAATPIIQSNHQASVASPTGQERLPAAALDGPAAALAAAADGAADQPSLETRATQKGFAVAVHACDPWLHISSCEYVSLLTAGAFSAAVSASLVMHGPPVGS